MKQAIVQKTSRHLKNYVYFESFGTPCTKQLIYIIGASLILAQILPGESIFVIIYLRLKLSSPRNFVDLSLLLCSKPLLSAATHRNCMQYCIFRLIILNTLMLNVSGTPSLPPQKSQILFFISVLYVKRLTSLNVRTVTSSPHLSHETPAACHNSANSTASIYISIPHSLFFVVALARYRIANLFERIIKVSLFIL